jgi:hypothetical protein
MGTAKSIFPQQREFARIFVGKRAGGPATIGARRASKSRKKKKGKREILKKRKKKKGKKRFRDTHQLMQYNKLIIVK